MLRSRLSTSWTWRIRLRTRRRGRPRVRRRGGGRLHRAQRARRDRSEPTGEDVHGRVLLARHDRAEGPRKPEPGRSTSWRIGARGGRVIPRLHPCARRRDGAVSLQSFKRRHRETHRPAIRASLRPHRPLHPHRVRPGTDVRGGGHVRLAHPVPWSHGPRSRTLLFKQDPPPSVSRNQAVRARARLTVTPVFRANVSARVPEAPLRRKSSLSNWRTGSRLAPRGAQDLARPVLGPAPPASRASGCRKGSRRRGARRPEVVERYQQ